MKSLPLALLLASVATASPGFARNQPDHQTKQSVAQLHRALAVVAAAVVPPGQSTRPVDPDQGDDHASPTAILHVCSKSTPAAQRSAICPTGISPD
jgi:hypothetical protein